MLSFHNDAGTKAKHLDQINAHLAMGRLGLFADWKRGRVSAVCLTVDGYDLALYPRLLGLPEWLGVAEDALLHVMPEDRASTWPRDFLAAIPVGIEAERLDCKVRVPFIVTLLDAARASFDRHRHQHRELDGVIVRAIELWQRPDRYERRWLAELTRTADRAYNQAHEVEGKPAWRAAMLVTCVCCLNGRFQADQIEEGLEYADPGRFDCFAADLLKLLQEAAPRRQGDPMLDAIRAAR